MSEVRLIDANALKANLPEPTNITQRLVYRTLCDFIDNAPTVEQPQGTWAFDEKGYFYCDKCGKYPNDQGTTTDFCPKCGAKMK